MYQTYRDRAAFLLVYIREAHPGSRLPGINDGKPIEQTETFEQRAALARETAATLELTMPVLVDREDIKVNTAYAAWPDRMAIVGVDGRVAYIGGPGPGGFRPAEVEDWLKKNTK